MELLPVESITTENALDLFNSKSETEKLLSDMRGIAESVQEFDLATAKGRKDCASAARKFATAKSKLEKLGKSLVDPIKTQAKVIDANRKLVRDTCDELRDKVRQPLSDFESAERERMESHGQAIEYILSLGAVTGEDGQLLGSDVLKCSLDEVNAVPVTEDHCHEYLPQYVDATQTARANLKHAIPNAEQKEKDEAEFAELRAMKEKAEAEQREKEIAESAAKVERERIEAIAAADKRDEEAAAAKRLADRVHISKVRTAAKLALVGCGISEIQAKQIVLAINEGQIPGVTINY